MTRAAPDLYFRVRENGAFVFRLVPESQFRRLEMEQIAVVNLKNREIKPHGDRDLTEPDLLAIKDWMEERREVLATRELDDILRTIDHLNLTTVWAQQRATPDDLERVDDALLLAMHDLRSVLVRKKADRLESED